MKRTSAAWLALILAFLLVANSGAFFFRQPYHEWWDLAANSLSVLRAKHFAQLYGPYSRWGFMHPGPALLYVEALGEWLFYDVLHVVPAPFNGQLLLHVLVMAGFFAAALQVFTRWLPRQGRWGFVALAAGAGTLHFAGTNGLASYDLLRGASTFESNWSAHALVLPFLCLLTAAASVAAGAGQDLPLLVIAGGFLVHTHVAQPLFVGPVAGIAYFTFLRGGARPEPGVGSRPSSQVRRFLRGIPAAWRLHPRAHGLAVAWLLAFLLPVALDLLRGRDGNAAVILRHLQTHRGEHKTLAASLFYFVQFGAYASYKPALLLFGHHNLPGTLHYLRRHSLLLSCWGLVALLAAWTTPHAWRSRRQEDRAAAQPFLGWCGVFLFLATGLSLYWGTIQDGEMFYYNSWFNFAIYYFALLLALAVLCGALATRHPRWLDTSAGRWLPVGFAVVVGMLSAGRWRVSDPAATVDQQAWANVRRAVRATPARGNLPACMALDFQEDAWHYAIGVALQLRRAGIFYTAPQDWRARFGIEPGTPGAYGGPLGTDLHPWRFEGKGTYPLRASSVPAFALRDGVFLNVGLPSRAFSETHPAFFSGEVALSDNFYYLALPNGNVFGYYTFTLFPCFYHQEMGFEYFFDAHDQKGGAYLYDFASKTFFYTSRDYAFPYLYDFSLNTVLYYFPDLKNPGHYTANPRYFYNMSTKEIITK